MKNIAYILIFSLFLVSCEEEEKITAENPQITFNFKHFYKDQVLDVRSDNSLIYTNEMGNEWNVKSIKYFISKLVIYKENGEAYDVNMYKLINPAEANTNYQTYILKDIPEGKYNRMSFIFGIDSARNRLLGLGNNSEVNAMEWPEPLGGGYHFMMMEGVYKNPNDILYGYAIHLGKNGNQFKAEFPIDVTTGPNSKGNIDIIMNIDQWFDGMNKIDLNDGYGNMMEDDAKQLLFKQNASNVFSIEQK